MALCEAARAGNLKLVEALLAQSECVDLVDYERLSTPLQIAVVQGNTGLWRLGANTASNRFTRLLRRGTKMLFTFFSQLAPT